LVDGTALDVLAAQRIMTINRFRKFRTSATWALASSFLTIHALAETSEETIAELTAAYRMF
jgi:hypothetical protein